ncbi:hypothetical protein [Alkalimonas mucilaginosa]|uniref:Carboxymuconolactone decarboxylase-like domain-containing protein n=1 Tax=Alkalimonas mucilaginosa TaxID=3057676 RepID=A0ABU7JIU2_9GAMM|nr:hypothetical protein [Alkalimonas sp. MEB004]MEE2025617.1 hypothetical protein [Alkalimonas sp. MEB004]
MIRYLLNKMLLTLTKHYHYDVRYQQDILQADLAAFLKFMGFQTMATHSGPVPLDALYAARIGALLSEDCGPCTQLAVDLALEAGVPPTIIQAIVQRDVAALPTEVALVVNFTELVLTRKPEADALREDDVLREEIVALWGQQGLIALAFAISAYRVYPALKYALGYGKACNQVIVAQQAVVPGKAPEQ